MKKKLAVTPSTSRAPVRSWSSAIWPLLRAMALALAAVVGATWALVRFYTHERQPMFVDVPVQVADAGLPDGEIAAPSLEDLPP